MNTKTGNDTEQPNNMLMDHNGNKYFCGLGVNDQGYLSAQHCWEVSDTEMLARLSK
jgi:hypothetical protein